MSVFDLLSITLIVPFNHGLPVGCMISGKAMAAHAIAAWSIFAGEGDNSHELFDTPFFHRRTEVMSSGGKKIALCWGQSITYDRDPPASQGPWPLTPAALSCFWKLWLEALILGFDANQASAWDDYTTLSMEITPKDVHDDRCILPVADLLALTETHPLETCYPDALCSAFLSRFAFKYTYISSEEIIRRTETMKAIMIAQQAPLPSARVQPTSTPISTAPPPDEKLPMALPSGFIPSGGPIPPSCTRHYPFGAATIRTNQDGYFTG
jgi:hypothetical protein